MFDDQRRGQQRNEENNQNWFSNSVRHTYSRKDYEIDENNEINENFGLFRYFRLFRNPSSHRILEPIRRHIARMKFQPIARMALINRIIFQSILRFSVFSHLRMRQWQDSLRESRIVIAILDPSVADHHEIALPA